MIFGNYYSSDVYNQRIWWEEAQFKPEFPQRHVSLKPITDEDSHIVYEHIFSAPK